MPGSIFISYSKRDLAFVRYLCALLEAEGFNVWYDDELEPGDEWWDRLEKQIIGCGAFIVVMSDDARQSKWVQRELLLAENHERPIFPILLSGQVWSHVADLQFAAMREGVRAPFPEKLRQRLNAIFGVQDAHAPHIDITIEEGDILTYPADVAVFKFARAFHGADLKAANLLESAGINKDALRPAIDAYSYQPTDNALAAPHVLFVGTPALRNISYEAIQQLGENTLAALKAVAPQTRHFAMTIHGANMGLDEREALMSQVNGYLAKLESGDYPPALRRISIIERTVRRVAPLSETLQAYLADVPNTQPIENGYRLYLPDRESPQKPQLTRPRPIQDKTQVYVVLPSGQARLEDVFYYGIQTAVHAKGLLCERVNADEITDGVMSQIKQRIDRAAWVIADVSADDPSVYWQIGYAWGRRKNVILLSDKAAQAMRFDDAEYIHYDQIRDVETALLERLNPPKRR